MNKWRLAFFGLIACALTLAACHGGAGSGGSLPTAGLSGGSGYTPYTGPSSLANFEWGKGMLGVATYSGPVAGDTVMVMHVQPQLQNGPGLIQYSRDVNDPRSSSFRHFITAQQIGQRYGASPATIRAIAKYFNQYGITVGGWPQSLVLNVRGSMHQFEHAFGTTFGWYQATISGSRCGGQMSCTIAFLGPTVQPHTSVVVPMTAVTGMLQTTLMATDAIPAPGNCQECAGFGLTAGQLRAAFDFNTAFNTLGANGAGVYTGIIGTGPVCTGTSFGACPTVGGLNTDIGAYTLYQNSTPSNIASIQLKSVADQPATAQNNETGTAPYDYAGAGNLSTPPTPTVNAVCTPGGSGVVRQNLQGCNLEDVEAQVDTEQQAALAPGATVDFYLAYEAACYNSTSGTYSSPSPLPTGTACPTGTNIYDLQGIDLTDDEIQQAIADNEVDTVAMSFGEGENAACAGGYLGTSSGTGNFPTCSDPTSGLGPLEFAALSAEGIAIFASTGDQANDECQNVNTGAFVAGYCVSYPATDPSVVAVGGVNAGINEAGQLVDEITAWGYEAGKGSTGSGGTAGGASMYFGEATVPFQNPVGTTIACYAGNGNPSCPYSFRMTPDVSLMADVATGVLTTYSAGNGWVGGSVGGTSVSAQQIAAQWADVLSYCKQQAQCDTASGAHAWRLGNPNTYYYALVANSSVTAGQQTWGYDGSIYNVQYGSNFIKSGATLQTNCCTAGPGYNPVLGLGVPFTYHLIQGVMHVVGVSGF